MLTTQKQRQRIQRSMLCLKPLHERYKTYSVEEHVQKAHMDQRKCVQSVHYA